MGRQVAASYGQSKHQMAVSTVAAGAVAGAASSIVVFMGDNALARMTEAKNRAVKAVRAWAELSGPLPATGQGTYYLLIDDSIAKISASGAVPALTEDDIAFLIDGEYAAPVGDGLTQYGEAQARQAIDVLLEDQKDT